MSWWLWQQSLGASERPWALAAAGAGLPGGGWVGVCAPFWERAMQEPTSALDFMPCQ